MKKKLLIPIVVAAVALAAILGGAIYFVFDSMAKPVVSTDPLTITYHDNGNVLLTWSQPKQGDATRLYIYNIDRMDYDYLGEYAGTAADIQGLDFSQNYVLKLEAVKRVSLPFVKSRELVSEEALTVSVYARDMHSPEITYVTNPAASTATIYWTAQSRLTYEVYSVDGNVYTGIHNAPEGSSVINFGTDLDMPEHDVPVQIAVRAKYSGNGYTIYSDFSEPVSIDRQDLLPTTINAYAAAITSRSFSITWDEARGDCYEVQQMDSNDNWQTVSVVSKTGERSYDTGTLPSGRTVAFRVVSTTFGAEENSFAATPAEIFLQTDRTTTYCTIWPTRELDLCSDDSLSSPICKVPAMTTLCVMEESGSAFKVMYGGKEGYIASAYCLIDLQEYLGELCQYNITNSYSSIFSVHNYSIRNLSGTVVKGYGNVQLSEGSYLVPYLYPCAKKLINAAEAAHEKGYVIRIYDAYRPNEATRMMYDTAALILDEVINKDSSLVRKSDSAGGAAAGQTYADYMTDNGRYSLGNFLANGASYHNMGIALDLTIADEATGEEIPMQTPMHDLSWYSEVARNNTNANTLRQIMVGAGFGTLSSEWWHFQDNDTRNQLGITSFVYTGVTPRGWMLDDAGWKYRLDDGTYAVDTTMVIDGESCSFDSFGYRQS